MAHPLESQTMAWQDGGIEHARAVVPINAKAAYISAMFQLGKRDPMDINILEMRKAGHAWEPWGGIAFPATIVFAIVDAIGAMGAGKPFDAPKSKSLAALTVEDETVHVIAKHVIELNTKRVVAIFHVREGKTRSVWICEHKRVKGGWSTESDMRIAEAHALELAKLISAFRMKM